MVKLEKQIYNKIIKLAIAGTKLSEQLRELQAQHPDEVDSEFVVAWEEIEALLAEHHKLAFGQGKDK